MQLDTYQSFIHKSRYARYLPEKQRRETWDETIERYCSFIFNHVKLDPTDKADAQLQQQLRTAIKQLSVMPSMRSLMTAGKPLDRDNTCSYNCSFLPIDDPKSFDEAMFIMMCGTGVGFSVERQYINQLPEVPDKLYKSDTNIIVKDSKEGWAKGFRQLLALLYSGEIPTWDLSRLRPAGAVLKTFGGRSSGPGPLDDLFHFTVALFKNAEGRKLTSIECHDLMCKIAEIVVVGGVRRAAMISLSNLSDDRMRNAKSGEWWKQYGHRSLANNSACYNERPDVGIFMEEWLALYQSKSGERGIFNRQAAIKQAEKNGRRDPNHEFGTNPCSEIIMRPYQFCNLTEVVVRPEDTLETLKDKVRLATILGTFQATLTYFPYLRKIWQKTTEEERLLGVSLTGIYDNKLLNQYDDPQLADRLQQLKQVAIDTNKIWAERLGINQSTAVTCVKPSGTVSELVDCASGIHPRFSRQYIRRVRIDKKDPLAQMMIDAGVDHQTDIYNSAAYVFAFAKQAPEDAILKDDINAIDHLKLWLQYQNNWCEHKPSITVSVKENEWPSVGAFVWENFDVISGISFLPYDGGSYRQAPFEDVDSTTWNQLKINTPESIDWDSLTEQQDNVEGAQTLACSAGGCTM